MGANFFHVDATEISGREKDYSEVDRLKLVKLLLKAGADPNAKDRCECSAFNQATWRTDVAPSLILLLDAGAKVNTKSKLGSSPIHNAAETGSVNVMKVLLSVPQIQLNGKVEKSVEKDGLVGNYRQTPIEVAISNQNLESAELLRAAGAKEAGSTK